MRETPTLPIRVLLADDHPLVRAGLRATVASAPDIALIGEATTGDEARRFCQDLAPDIVLLDLHMPGPPPVATVAYLREHCPATRVLAKSMCQTTWLPLVSLRQTTSGEP